jgi:hypothetical protein
MVPKERIPYPPEEQKADRKAGRRAARAWMPRDPRHPDPPPEVRLICVEVFEAVLAEYRTHVVKVGDIDADLAAAQARVTAGAVAVAARSDAATSATAHPPTDGAADYQYREFDLARDEQLRREAAAAHVEDRERAARLQAQRDSAERDYRLIFAAHATKGVRRIRTVLGEVLTRHPLRNQLEPLDQRCLDELDKTIKMLSALPTPDLTGGHPLQPDDEEWSCSPGRSGAPGR